MSVLIIVLIGTGILGGQFFKLGFDRFNILTLLIGLCGLAYVLYPFYHYRLNKKPNKEPKGDVFLWAFIIFGIAVAGASYAGFFRDTVAVNELFDTSYIPRQAYYLFFLPLIPLLGGSYQARRWLDYMERNYRVFYIFVYVCYVLLNQTIALDVYSLFCLSVILLMGRERNRLIDILLLLILVLSPIHVGGEMTQMICRAYCVFFFFVTENKKLLRYFISFSICIILSCYLAPFIPIPINKLDADTSWRLLYWRDELTQLLHTDGLGVGYGTSYATTNFVGSAVSGPFAADSEYSSLEKIFVVGCHNSFVSLAFRLGFIGIILLFGYLISCAGRNLSGPRFNYGIFAVASALIIICFNVGFENPGYFTLFVFAFTSVEALTNTGDTIPMKTNTNGRER